MEDVYIFYGYLFGIFCGYLFGTFGGHLIYLVYFSRFGTLHQEKSGNPVLDDPNFAARVLFYKKSYPLISIANCFQSVIAEYKCRKDCYKKIDRLSKNFSVC
jgi:hypothetical protein